MRRRFVVVVAILFIWPAESFALASASSSNPTAFVRALLDAADGGASFAEIQLAIDKFADPSVDLNAARAKLDEMKATIDRMLRMIPAEAASTSAGKFEVLRDFIYRSGWWNEERPFQYDFDDPFGRTRPVWLLSHYLQSRKGNCVSMPLLFLVLGERLGLNVTLSTAPFHVFAKWTDDASGRTFNLETTSGAGFARDAYYREGLKMTDAAVKNGVYLKTLDRRETVVVMADAVLQRLLETKRYDDTIAVADVILEAYPAHVYALIQKGNAYHQLLKHEFRDKFPRESDIPADLLPRAMALYRANLDAFAKAEALGWLDTDIVEVARHPPK